MTKDKSKKVGKLGEDALQQWAHQIGFTVTKPDEDEQGWDFLLEAHPPNLTDDQLRSSYDRRAFPAKYWIQVKSTNKKPGTWPVKLDNWERLVKTPYPSFFLVCEFDNNTTCQRAYLVHVDESYIRKVMQRLREHSVNPKTELHNVEMTFKYDDSNRMTNLDGQGLLSELQRYVGNDVESYATQKVKFVESVGYEEGAYAINFSFSISKEQASDPISHFVDFSLGLVPHIETDNLEIRDKRFGIEAPGLSQSYQSGRIMTKQTPINHGQLVIAGRDPYRTFMIPVDVYAPHGLPENLLAQYRRFRLTAGFIDIIMNITDNSYTGELKIRLPLENESCSLQSLSSVANLHRILWESFQANTTTTLELWIGSERLVFRPINPAQFVNFFNAHTNDVCQAIIDASEIAKFFDITLGTRVTISQLVEQRFRLQVQASVLSGRACPSFELSVGVSEEGSTLPTCWPFMIDTVIGDSKVVLALVAMGHPKLVNDSDSDSRFKIQLITNTPKMKRNWILPKAGMPPTQSIKAWLQSVVDEFSDRDIVLLPDDYQEVLNS